MKFIKKLGHNLFTAFIVLIIAIIGFASSAFLISSDLKHIPLGFLLSGGIIAFIHVISHFLVKIDVKRGSATFTIVSIILRLTVFVASLLLIGLMYYRWDMKYFNIFVFVGVYTASMIAFCLSFILSKEGKEQEIA